MKAMVQESYGTMEFRAVEPPVAAEDEVLVEVHAASVNAYDWHVLRGDPYLARLMSPFFGLRSPRTTIRGRDFAGRVAATGRNVTKLKPGDEVYGDAGHRGGAFAEYVCVPEGQVAHRPAGLTAEEAAAVPLAANTALMGIRDVAKVVAGQRVLINGASGGVGTFAVQIAKAYGAEVTAVCRTRNVDMVRGLGADHVIDYTVADPTAADFTRSGSRYDVVFDLVGNHSLTGLRRASTRSGTLVLSGGGVSKGGSVVGPMGLVIRSKLVAPFVRQRLVTLTEVPSRENLVTLRELIESGKVSPVIDRTYPLGETLSAVEYLEREHARAKVVITV